MVGRALGAALVGCAAALVGRAAALGERTRIARELHDPLLQGFQGLMFRLQVVRRLDGFGRNPAGFSQILLGALGLGLSMLGPGAWSLDARLFGRKQITFTKS